MKAQKQKLVFLNRHIKNGHNQSPTVGNIKIPGKSGFGASLTVN
jgi:hypothetical protein